MEWALVVWTVRTKEERERWDPHILREMNEEGRKKGILAMFALRCHLRRQVSREEEIC